MPEKLDAAVPEKDKTAPQKKKKPIILFIAVAVFFAISAGIFLGKKVSAHTKPVKKVVEKGPILVLDEFLVNLNDPGDHFLKVTVALELSKDKGKTPESLKDQIPPIRDAILSSLAIQQRDELGTLDGREKLKLEIKKSVNDALGDDIVTNVYFTNFVTQ